MAINYSNPLIIGIIAIIIILVIVFITVLAKKRTKEAKRPLNEIIVLFVMGLAIMYVFGQVLGKLGITIPSPGIKTSVVLGLILVGMGILAKAAFGKIDTEQVIIITFALVLDILAIVTIDKVLPMSIIDIRPVLESVLSVVGQNTMSLLGVS